MGHIQNHYTILGKEKNLINANTEFGAEIIRRLNTTNLTPKERFIKSMKEVTADMYVFCDDETEFAVYTKFGMIYDYCHGEYTLQFYPRPARIPISIIKNLIEQEVDFNDYDHVAELYRFLSLTDEEKDEQGFAYYHWIWQDGLWESEKKIYHFGSDKN